jgi:hypothetical protein
MFNKKLLILLSIIVILLAINAMIHLPSSDYSAVGSLFGAVGSLLAVIWFSASLFYQSIQLKEQREQFLEEFKQLREDARRSALLLSKDILREAEERALRCNPELQSINDLTAYYLNFSDLATALKSKDPNEVLEAVKRWLKREGPAIFLLRGIKQAAEIYFHSIAKKDIDYSKEPEEFVYIYGPWLWNLPYFEPYQAIATMLCEFMISIQPGRKSVILASSVAFMKSYPDIANKDAIFENIKKVRKDGKHLPAIAEDIETG